MASNENAKEQENKKDEGKRLSGEGEKEPG